MATLTFNKSNAFPETIAEGAQGTNTLKIALTNTAPIAGNVNMAAITQIASGNGYTTGGETVTIDTSSQTAGTYSLTITGNVSWTAVTGSMATFRYLVLYDDTQTGDPLFGWWDHGSAVTLGVGDTYTFNTDGVTLISGT